MPELLSALQQLRKALGHLSNYWGGMFLHRWDMQLGSFLLPFSSVIFPLLEVQLLILWLGCNKPVMLPSLLSLVLEVLGKQESSSAVIRQIGDVRRQHHWDLPPRMSDGMSPAEL